MRPMAMRGAATPWVRAYSASQTRATEYGVGLAVTGALPVTGAYLPFGPAEGVAQAASTMALTPSSAASRLAAEVTLMRRVITHTPGETRGLAGAGLGRGIVGVGLAGAGRTGSGRTGRRSGLAGGDDL